MEITKRTTNSYKEENNDENKTWALGCKCDGIRCFREEVTSVDVGKPNRPSPCGPPLRRPRLHEDQPRVRNSARGSPCTKQVKNLEIPFLKTILCLEKFEGTMDPSEAATEQARNSMIGPRKD